MKTSKIHILLIDDDKYFRMAIKSLLSDFAVFTEAETENQAIGLIKSHFYDLALIDMEMETSNCGLEILATAKQKKVHSIIVSSQNDPKIIELAYEGGCDHFLSKSKYKSSLKPYIIKYIKNNIENSLKDFFEEKYITQHAPLKRSVQDICDINLQDKTIFLTGETGVGKSLIGELLHKQTYSKERPYIHINCSEIPESLIESELFGHQKGSFTGAIESKKGKLELASGGTLFLDEIGTMPKIMQQKLLKAIEEKTFYPIGSSKPCHSNFTLISATCEDLFEKIHQGEFRKDLFFRISGINLEILPLRERSEDIPLLVNHFLNQSHRRFIIKEDAISKLKMYDWPGNIRELKKTIDLLSTRSKGIINSNDISFINPGSSNSLDNTWLTPSQVSFITDNGLRSFIKRIEEESIKNTLQKNKGKITHTIKDLGISSSAFYRIFENLEA